MHWDCRAEKALKHKGQSMIIGVGNDNLFQYSCLENPMNRGVWQATVHGIAKSWTLLSTNMHTQHNDNNFNLEQAQ